MAMPVDTTAGVASAATAATLLPGPGPRRLEPSSSMSDSSSSRTKAPAKARKRGKPPRRNSGSAASHQPARPLPATSQPPRWKGGRLRKARKCLCCNSMEHQKPQCPHVAETCTYCGMVGHIQLACRRLNTNGPPPDREMDRSPSRTPVPSVEAEVSPCMNCTRGLTPRERRMGLIACEVCDPPPSARGNWKQTTAKRPGG